MEIKGLTAANLKSLANVLEISASKLLQNMTLHFMETLTVEQSIKLSGCESEEEVDRVFKEVITPMLEGKDTCKKI